LRKLHLGNTESEGKVKSIKLLQLVLERLAFDYILWMEWSGNVSKIGFDIRCVERYGSVAVILYLIGSLL
jgi:hypothetical protein